MEEQVKALSLLVAKALESNEKGEENKKEDSEELLTLTSYDPNRGGGSLARHLKRQNFAIFWGCRSGMGIVAKTNMVTEIAKIFDVKYNKKTYTLSIPICFEDIQSKDANFEMSISNTL